MFLGHEQGTNITKAGKALAPLAYVCWDLSLQQFPFLTDQHRHYICNFDEICFFSNFRFLSITSLDNALLGGRCAALVEVHSGYLDPDKSGMI